MANRKRKFDLSLLDIIDGLDEEICSSSPRFARVKDLLAYLNWASGVFKVNGNETNIILFPWSFFKLPDQGSDWRKELRTRPDEYLAHLEERIDYFAFSNMMSAFDQGKNNFIKFLRNIGIKNLKKYYESLRHQEEEMSHTTAHIPRVLAPPPNAQSPVLRSQGHEEISIQISDESDDDEVVKISEEFTPPIASEDSMESPDKPRCTTSILSKLLDEKLRYSFSTYLEQQIGLVTVSDLFSEAAAVRIPQDTQIAETFVAEESFTCVLRSIALALEERASGQVEELMVATRLGELRLTFEGFSSGNNEMQYTESLLKLSEIIRKVPLVVGKVKPILRDLGWILLKTKKPDDNIFFPPWTVHKLETDLKVILTSKKYVSESLLCNLTERTADRLRAPTEALRYRPEHRLDLEYVRISNNTLFYRERWLWFVNSLQTYYLDRMLDYFKKSLSTVETLLADPAEGENRQADERETYIGDQDQAGIRIIDQGPIPYLDLSTHSTEDSVEVGAQSSEESDGDDVVGIFDEPTSSHNDNAHVSEVSSPSTPDQPKMQALAETGANNTSKRKHSAVQGHVDTQANKNDGSRMAIMQQEDRDTDNLPLGHVKKQAKTISFTFNDNPPTKLPPHTVCFPNLLSQADLAGTLSSLLSISCVNSCEVTCSLLRSTDGIFTLRDLLKQCCVRIGGVTSSINPAVLDMEIMEVLVGIGKAVQSSSHSAHRDPQAYDSDAALPSALISVPNDSVVVGSSFPVRETIAGVLGVEEDVGMLIQWYLEDFMLFRSHSK